MDMLSVPWVWADYDRRAPATTAAVPQPARGPLPDSPRSAQAFIRCRRDKALPATAVICLGTPWESPFRARSDTPAEFFPSRREIPKTSRGLIRLTCEPMGCGMCKPPGTECGSSLTHSSLDLGPEKLSRKRNRLRVLRQWLDALSRPEIVSRDQSAMTQGWIPIARGFVASTPTGASGKCIDGDGMPGR